MSKFSRTGFQKGHHWDSYVKAKSKVEAFCFFFEMDNEWGIDEEMLDSKTYLVFVRDMEDGIPYGVTKAAIVKELYYSWELESNIYDVRPVFGNYNDE